jgi:hypothetical protein
MHGDMERILMEPIVFYLGYYPNICLEGLRDSNQVPPEYDWSVTVAPVRLVLIFDRSPKSI